MIYSVRSSNGFADLGQEVAPLPRILSTADYQQAQQQASITTPLTPAQEAEQFRINTDAERRKLKALLAPSATREERNIMYAHEYPSPGMEAFQGLGASLFETLLKEAQASAKVAFKGMKAPKLIKGGPSLPKLPSVPALEPVGRFFKLFAPKALKAVKAQRPVEQKTSPTGDVLPDFSGSRETAPSNIPAALLLGGGIVAAIVLLRR